VIPVQVRFENLEYSVNVQTKKGKKKVNEKRVLLRNITGTIEPGTLIAIMGASGAGKTTLLNVLAGRSRGQISGKLLLNGHSDPEAKSFRRKQAYIMQDDVLLRTQNPKEIIRFSAFLRLPSTMPSEIKEELVSYVINELSLQKCVDTRVGAPGIRRGVSGGERKRVALGQDLVTNPSLLFVDEPTSGLDSTTAMQVISILKRIAKKGRTIICTIHQPSTEIFDLFDSLLLLAHGQIVYFGPSSEAVQYFTSLGYPCPMYMNPTDHFMKLIVEDPNDSSTKERVKMLIDSYENSQLSVVQKESKVTTRELPPKQKHKGYERSASYQIYALTRRSVVDFMREPIKLRAGLIQALFLSVLVGLIYLRLGKTVSDSQSRLGALFFVIVNQSFASVTALVNSFPSERVLFMREHGNRMYSLFSFYMSKVFSDTPFQILTTTIFATIIFWMIGFSNSVADYLYFLLILILVANVGSALGLMIGILAPNSSVAIAVTPAVLLPFMIFSGFFVNSDSIPVYFIWVPWISFVQYGFHALVINQFSHITFTCPNSVDQLPGGQCRIQNGQQLIDQLHFGGRSIAIDICVLIAMYFVYRVLGFLALIYRAHKEKAKG